VPRIIINDMAAATLQIPEEEYPQALFKMIARMKEHEH
jgi:hypothetical protein